MRVWTYQALTVNSAARTDGKARSSTPTEPSGIRSAALRYQTRKSAQQSVARCNLRNRTNRRSRPCVGLERAMICTAPWKAWQPTERGLRLSRTPHARSSCIIINPHDSVENAVPSNRRLTCKVVRGPTVSVKWSVRRANCKRFTTYGRLTESAQEQ